MLFLRRLSQRFAPGPGAQRRNLPALDQELVETIVSSGLWDADYYLSRYPEVEGFPGGALHHFVQHGLKEGRDPSPSFNVAAYLHRHAPARKAKEPAFLFALRHAEDEEHRLLWRPDDNPSLAYLLRRSGLFDPAWYLRHNRDVAGAKIDPFDHFLERGAFEFRDPGPDFDTRWYLGQHRDYLETSRTPIEYFLRLGQALGHPTKGLPPYDAWMERFDALSDEDTGRLRALGAASSVRIHGVHVVDAEAAERFESIVLAWDAQLGPPVRPVYVRGRDVSDGAWERCLDRLGGRGGVRDAREALTAVADGTCLLLCDGATWLRPHAALVLAESLRRVGAEAAYADHDHIDASGRRSRPVFKPAMSPAFMRRLPYAGRLVAAVLSPTTRESLVRAIETAAAGAGAGAWAEALLASDPCRVERVAFILSHRPLGEAAEGIHHNEPVGPAIRSPAAVSDGVGERPHVTIIIPSRDQYELLSNCVISLEASTDYPRERFTILVVDNGSAEDEALAYLADLESRDGCVVVRSPGPFNFSLVCNAGAAAARGEVLVFLNNDTTVNRPDWLRRLVDEAARPETGLVGAQLLYPDGTIQHGGVVLGGAGVGKHRLVGIDGTEVAAFDVTREMTVCTGACLAVRRSVFEELGGFDPLLRIAFNDVDLCARAYEAGYRNMYVAEPLLIHHESKSRGFEDTPVKQARSQREAITVRTRHGALFRDDPSYSPNLSLSDLGGLAVAPRTMRPWRRSPTDTRRVLICSSALGLGHGVATVVAEQAAFLLKRGWEVTIGGPPVRAEMAFPGCRRVRVWAGEDTAALVMEEGIDCVIAHTPPFFSVVRHLGDWPLVYFHDHGEPPAKLFPDTRRREAVDWEKRFCAPLAKRVFVISRAVHNEQYRSDAVVVRNGNTHLARWSNALAERRAAVRDRLGVGDRFLILNACRFGPGERFYKGVDRYGELAMDFGPLHPDLAGRVLFALAGRGDKDDVAHAEAAGLAVYPNVSDAEMIDLYIAADLYMSLSEWEGYNLGIGQARALGLDVLASDIPAHREFGIETAATVVELAAAVALRVRGWTDLPAGRSPVVEPWDVPLAQLADLLEADRAACAGTAWS